MEEETFHMLGIICRSDLPPIRIMITGLSTPSFDNDMNNVEKLHSMMTAYLEGENIKVKPWQAEVYEGHKAIDTSARYFTEQRFAPMETRMAFEMGVDPCGVLARLCGSNFIHGMDNKVDYLQECANEQGMISVKHIEPAAFKTGDIVWATISFVAYKDKDNYVSMNVVLKTLTLIEEMNKTNRKYKADSHKTMQKLTVIKRKRAFDEEKNARHSMESMFINS
ncbi:hypothetical protein CVT25_007650 [Psilocybe cyanescens]|uniref:Uncharacterized protein n=1 Tax=Psilocybe cyanescens TaxID=93625 RepID=A0A409XVB6_PSICY|nr:hypothetical protein CVT25_007650 [Psilocybe cyanescens]